MSGGLLHGVEGQQGLPVSIGPVLVVGDELLPLRREPQPRFMVERAPNVEQAARPMVVHRQWTELVVLRQAFPFLVLVDEMDDAVLSLACQCLCPATPLVVLADVLRNM